MIFRFLNWIVLIMIAMVALTAPESQAAQRLKVLSFNTWLFPFFSKNLSERLDAFAREVTAIGPDLMAFQEVWRNGDKERLAREFRQKGYGYSYFTEGGGSFLKGFMGNGLLIVSRFPFEASSQSVMSFSEPSTLLDYFMSKGALHVTVNLPNSEKIDFFDAHFGATRSPKDRARHFRQAEDLMTFVQKESHQTVRILGMDANVTPFEYDEGSKQYTATPSRALSLIENSTGMIDTTPKEPTYSTSKNPNLSVSLDEGPDAHLDYILLSKAQTGIIPVSSQVVLTRNLPETGNPLSDHYGVLTELIIRKP